MTYRELQKVIDEFSSETLDSEVTVYDYPHDAYRPVECLNIALDDDGELDPDQPVLVINYTSFSDYYT